MNILSAMPSWSNLPAGSFGRGRPQFRRNWRESSSGWVFTAESWRDAMDKLGGERLLGRFFAASRDKLREIVRA